MPETSPSIAIAAAAMNFDFVDMAFLLLEAKANTLGGWEILRCRKSITAELANGLFTAVE
jgi:hypothetical protein